MVTDGHVSELRRLISTGKSLAAEQAMTPATDIHVEQPDLNDFEDLIPTFSKDGTRDHETETQNVDNTPQSELTAEQDAG